MFPVIPHKDGFIAKLSPYTYLNKNADRIKGIGNAHVFKTQRKAELACISWVKS